MRTAYKVRVYPTPEQAAVLNRTFGCVRLAWNQVLDWRTKRHLAEGLSTSYAQTDRYLTQLKKTRDLAFLCEVSSVPLQQALRHQQTAFVSFFAKRSRYPRQWSWPGIDPTRINPTTVTVSRDPDGMWYASFAVDTMDSTSLPQVGDQVGIDLGVKDFAVTSDGERIANPRHLERRRRNLARYERRKARKRRGSANRKKAARKVAVAHGKVRRARQDFLQKTSTVLVRRYDVIVVEDLNVVGMVGNRSLARAISGCGWSTFRAMLEYKAARWGRRLVVIDRWHPSSKLCSYCGHLLAELSLSTRRWTCPDCGTRHDRDVNAAKNILAEGLSVSACGADVRHSGTSRVQSAAKQEVRLARGGNPLP